MGGWGWDKGSGPKARVLEKGLVGISEMQLCLIGGQGWREFLGGAYTAGEALSGTRAAAQKTRVGRSPGNPLGPNPSKRLGPRQRHL